MSSKIKNIILFAGIGIALILAYTMLIKKDEEPNIISSAPSLPTSSPIVGASVISGSGIDPTTAGEILSLLLSVRSIRLDDSVFADIAFISLEDTTVQIFADGTEGRPNPFAPIGFDILPNATPAFPESEDAPSEETVPLDAAAGGASGTESSVPESASSAAQ